MISFIIPTYKNVHSLMNCVSTIIGIAENGELDYEVVLVYNCPTIEFVKPIVELGNLQVKLYENPRTGAHYSRQLGLLQSVGDIVVFVDDDNYLKKEYVQFIVKTIANRDEKVFIGCASKEYHNVNWEALRLQSSSFACGSLKNVVFRDNIPVYWGAGMAMSRKLAIEIFKEELMVEGRMAKKKYVMSGEDHEMSLRAYSKGAMFHYFSDIGLLHDFDRARLTNDYHDRLMVGFTYAAWTLRWYYLGLKRSFWMSNFFVAYTGNMARAILYFLRYPLKLASKLILADAFQLPRKKRQFGILKKYTGQP